MKNNLSVITLLLLSGLTLFITFCTKEEDPEKLRKEALTLELNEEINTDSLEAIVLWLQDMGTRFTLADNRRDVAVKIRKRFAMMGYQDARLDSFEIERTYRNINYRQWQYNVIATLEGNSYPDSVCIVGGHYDNILQSGDPFSIVPGANDNASGVAAAMEIARVMKRKDYSPRNTIEFIAFGAEELGLYGSSAYALYSNQHSRKIKFMLNNDMIAYQPNPDESSWIVNIIDYDNSHTLRLEAEQMCNRFTSLYSRNDNTYNKQSDSYPFYLYGYKAIFFDSDILDPNYHSPNDIADNCNFDYCREIVKISCALLVNNN
jgi:hypothetical protein